MRLSSEPIRVSSASEWDAPSESDLAREMAGLLSVTARQSASDALKELRHLFPDVPLAVRVAALNVLRLG